MRTYFTGILVLAYITLLGLTQVAGQTVPPEVFNFNAMVHDTTGLPLINRPVGLRFSILEDGFSGPAVYVETQTDTTSSSGLLAMHIGAGTVVSGSFSGIDWPHHSYYLQVEIDVSAGTNYQVMSTTQLVSVPYAMHAATANSAINDHDTVATNELQHLSISNDTVFLTDGGYAKLPATSNSTPITGKYRIVLGGSITNAQAVTKLQQELGTATREIYIINTDQLTSIDLSGVDTIMNIKVEGNEVLQTITASNLVMVYGSINVTDNSVLNTIDLPVLENIRYDVNIFQNPGLQYLNIPALTYCVGGDYYRFRLEENAFSSSEVNYLLARLVGLSSTLVNVTVLLQNQNPPAPPTGQGLIDKQTLISNGNSVLTD